MGIIFKWSVLFVFDSAIRILISLLYQAKHTSVRSPASVQNPYSTMIRLLEAETFVSARVLHPLNHHSVSYYEKKLLFPTLAVARFEVLDGRQARMPVIRCPLDS